MKIQVCSECEVDAFYVNAAGLCGFCKNIVTIILVDE